MKRDYTRFLTAFVFLPIAMVSSACSHPVSGPVVTSADVPAGQVVYPEILPETPGDKHAEIEHEFLFEGTSYKLSFSIDRSVYEAAKEAPRTVKIAADAEGVDWAPGYQAALIEDPAQDSFYETVLSKLRAIRDAKELDSDRYAELLAIFVQSIAYCTKEGQPPKFPIETVVDECGDCDDKSRLLAGLLTVEGYDGALLIFHDEKHMAVGIRSPRNDFKETGYAYIETTSPAYIGFPSYEYSEVKLHSVPQVIPIGDGKTGYTSGAQVAYLHETLQKLRKNAEKLEKKLEKAKTEGERMKAEYEAYSEKIKKAKGSLSAAEHNKLADQANKYGKKYNRAVKNHNDLVSQINLAGEIMVHVIDHPDDRRGMYKWVRKKMGR